jgi:hypothetical protein
MHVRLDFVKVRLNKSEPTLAVKGTCEHVAREGGRRVRPRQSPAGVIGGTR